LLIYGKELQMMDNQDFKAEIIRKTTGMIRTFLDELANETSQYKSLHNLTEQVEHQYENRFLIELIQNAHDAMNVNPEADDKGRLEILVVQEEEPYGALYVANDGSPFTRSNFECLSQLGQSDKDPEKSIGNKGIGFRSVLEISNSPEIYSRSSKDSKSFDGYCFYFSPDVTGQYEKPILMLTKDNDKPFSPLDDTLPLIEWSQEKLLHFRRLYCSKDDQWLTKELKYLSPYLLPIPISSSNKTNAINTFENQGFASVIRLPFKNYAARTLAIEMTERLDENTILFLDQVKFLSLDSGMKQRLVERKHHELNDSNNGQEIRLEVIEDGAEGYIKKKYWLWSDTIGGDDQPEERDEISKAIIEDNLPGRWPELKKATVSLAVKIDKEPEQGRINIYLPTQLPTGCAAHFNGPFYGDMSRTDISFNKKFNNLLLLRIAHMAVDIILESLAGKEVDHARAILDILAPSTEDAHAGSEWFNILKEVCNKKGLDLDDKSIIFTDKGWTTIKYASLIPEIDSPNVLTPDKLRKYATFDVIHQDLIVRQSEITALFNALRIEPLPLYKDLATTIETIAKALHEDEENANWNGFWYDLIKLFKNDAEVLKGKEILLGNDRSLHMSGPDCTVFFPPKQGMDDDEVQIEGDSSDIPMTLRAHIAFLNDKIEIYNPNDARHQTPIRKFVEMTLVQRYRVMEILRSVLIPKIPTLPVPLRGEESRICHDILIWALKLIAGMPDRGKGKSGTLHLLRQIPVPCHGGWYPIGQTSFGPGWPGTAGKDVFEYLKGANTRECQKTLGKMLLPPSDELWDAKGEIFQDLLESSGVFNGLKLVSIEPTDWKAGVMTFKSSYQLPDTPPPCISDDLWKKYSEKYSPQIRDRMSYAGYFSYEVQSLSVIPGLEQYTNFDEKTRTDLMNSLFVSIQKWDQSWLTTYIKKIDGNSQIINIDSPLSFCLKSLPWIAIDSDGTKEWELPSRRWYIPKINLAGQRWRFEHLRPLPGLLADKLDRSPELYNHGLVHLGMPKFDPDPEERSSSTRLLEDLASALDSDIPDRNMFINHIRAAWSHYEAGYSDALPSRIIIKNSPKNLEAIKPDLDHPVYLPDSSESFVSELDVFSLPVIEILTPDAKRLASFFKRKYGGAVRLASEMKVWPIIDGQRWVAEPGILISESEFSWLPSVLLTLYAFVGSPPPGLYTKKISESVKVLREAKICGVTSLKAGLWMGEESIAEPPVAAMWISQEKVLICDIAFKNQLSKYAEALKTIIKRDDLELPLKHVLERLENLDAPTHEDICTALESLKIKQPQYDQAYELWKGDLGSLIRMSMPIIALLKPDLEAFGAVADISTEESLQEYLQGLGIAKPTPQEIVKLIRFCDDYYMIGENLHKTLGEAAELDKWNAALDRVGEKKLSNKTAEEDFRSHLRSVQVLLQATIAHIMLRNNQELLSFEQLIEQLNAVPFPQSLASQFWSIEFQTALQSITILFGNINALPGELSAFKNSRSPEELKINLLIAGVNTSINPINTHRQNHEKFKNLLIKFMKIAVASCIRQNISPLSWEKSPEELISSFEVFFKNRAYLGLCSDKEFYQLLKSLPREESQSYFWDQVDHSEDLQTLTIALSLSSEDIEGADRELEKYKDIKRKQNRLTPVCEKEFDYTDENLSQLWNHIISQIEEGSLPIVNLQNTSSLEEIAKRKRKQNVGEHKKPGKPKGRTSKEMEHLIGFAGEIHAYRMLAKTYGEDIVHPGSWKSTYSKRVFPGNNPDDNLGYDFIIHHKKKNYHIEVKSSADDNDSFELGSSQIRAAMEMARKKKPVFMIMHVFNALTKNPGFRLLPNPYDPRCEGVYSIEDAGARIRYRLKS
jgi:hypothetical protein